MAISIPTRKNGQVEIHGHSGRYATTDGKIFNRYGKELAAKINMNGYYTVRFQEKKVRKQYLVHRLLAETFVDGRTDERNTVNHKNGVKTDNAISNLEWCTPKENIVHAHRIGLCNPVSGEKQGRAKIKNSEAKFIREYLSENDTFERRKYLSEKFSVRTGLIAQVARGRSYKTTDCGTPICSKKKFLTKDQVLEIKKLLINSELSQNKIAKKFGVKHPTVWKIAKNLRHKEHIEC